MSFVAYYSSTTGLFLGDPEVLIWVLVGFWAGNFAFIGTIFSGLNKRLPDPAMSLPQMYWAMLTTNIALTFTLELDTLYYLLIMLTMVFGIFRVSVSQFNTFCYLSILVILLSLSVRYTLYPNTDIGTTAIHWLAFSFCAITLTSICKSIVRLRFRLKEKNEQLKEAVQAKSDFLANMSHEIRTPMNGVIGMLDVALISEKNPDQKRYLTVARNSANSLLTIINDILDFSKFESGKLELEAIDTDIESLVHQVLTNFSGIAEQKNVELISDISPTLTHHAILDPNRLKQVLNNLISNALKFTPEGEILVKVRAEKLKENHIQLHFIVRDTGIGIAPNKIDKLFESFTQADTSTTREYGGTGLGLTIVKQLCESMNGDISIESTEGKGSTFSFYVDAERSDTQIHIPTVPAYIKDFRVLLVDDNATCRSVICKYLEFLEIQCVAVENAKQALIRIERGSQFDAVIIDRHIQGMTGETLAQQLRLQATDDAIPLIMLSTVHAGNSQQLIKDFQLTAYLTKPVRARELYTALGLTFKNSCFISDHEEDPTPAPLSAVTAKGLDDTNENCARHKKNHLLLVEDNKTNQEVATLTLDVLGYSVEIANDGLEAVQILRQCHVEGKTFGAILMDCQMPRMDGFQTTETIRNNPDLAAFKYIPIIAMTANAREEDRKKCLASGMNDYLKKPIESDLLKSTLAHWLDEQDDNTETKNLPETADTRSPTTESLVWNKSKLDNMVGNNPDRTIKLISGFVSSLLSMRTELETALESNQYETAIIIIHGLKGASSNLRVERLADSSSTFEHALQTHEEDTIADAYQHFCTELETAVNHLSEFLESAGSSS